MNCVGLDSTPRFVSHSLPLPSRTVHRIRTRSAPVHGAFPLQLGAQGGRLLLWEVESTGPGGRAARIHEAPPLSADCLHSFSAATHAFLVGFFEKCPSRHLTAVFPTITRGFYAPADLLQWSCEAAAAVLQRS